MLFCGMGVWVNLERCPGAFRSAITLGRVAWVCPAQLAPHLAHFAAPWCNALRSIRDDVEKEHAFLGLCALLRANPEVLSCPPLIYADASLWLRVALLSSLFILEPTFWYSSQGELHFPQGRPAEDI
jgi:hypothetical protein